MILDVRNPGWEMWLELGIVFATSIVMWWIIYRTIEWWDND